MKNGQKGPEKVGCFFVKKYLLRYQNKVLTI